MVKKSDYIIITNTNLSHAGLKPISSCLEPQRRSSTLMCDFSKRRDTNDEEESAELKLQVQPFEKVQEN